MTKFELSPRLNKMYETLPRSQMNLSDRDLLIRCLQTIAIEKLTFQVERLMDILEKKADIKDA